MTHEAILSAMLALVPVEHQIAEPMYDAIDRYSTIATAIANEAGGDDVLARYLLAVARHESSYREDVHSCATLGDEGRSVSAFQILVGEGRALFTGYRRAELCGVDLPATARATATAGAYLRFALQRCGGDRPVCVFSVYGGVTTKADPRIVARVATLFRLRRRAARGIA
jgi:hypothetical protein